MTAGARWWGGFELIANVSILFADVAIAERPAIARSLGFDRIESWWPFPDLAPTDDARAAFVASLTDAHVRLASLNTYAGDMAAGDRGLAAVPGAAAEFERCLRAAVELVGDVGCPNLHVLLGNADPDDAEVVSAGLGRLTLASRLAAERGARVVVEVLNPVDNPGYVLTSLDRAVRWIDEVRQRTGGDSVAFQFDAYHLTMLGEDLVDAVERSAGVIGHVQVADVPGRGAPGTGSIDFQRLAGALRSVGYEGAISLEYVGGSVPPADRVAWLR